MLSEQLKTDLFDFCLQIGDDRLILGHRLSEWCGHGPVLEEDIALGNLALDSIGQANAFLGLAAQFEGKGRSADDLAYRRDCSDFKNIQLVELPNGDFAVTILRQFFYDAFAVPFLEKLTTSKHPELAGLAAKSLKEARYHLRHSSEWVKRLGDGTEESAKRMQQALNQLYRYTNELFVDSDYCVRLAQQGYGVTFSSVKSAWDECVGSVFKDAHLSRPEVLQNAKPVSPFIPQGRLGKHTEHLGHLLAEMQFLPRAYPDAKW